MTTLEVASVPIPEFIDEGLSMDTTAVGIEACEVDDEPLMLALTVNLPKVCLSPDGHVALLDVAREYTAAQDGSGAAECTFTMGPRFCRLVCHVEDARALAATFKAILEDPANVQPLAPKIH